MAPTKTPPTAPPAPEIAAAPAADSTVTIAASGCAAVGEFWSARDPPAAAPDHAAAPVPVADASAVVSGDDMDDEQVPEMGAEMPQEMPAMEVRDDEEEDPDMDEAFIREYVEKVTAKMGDNGQNTKSTVAGKNDMGGTTANMTKGFADNGKGGTQGGLLNPSTKDQNGGNVNVPGGKAGVKHLKTVSAGHGAEKKGAKPDSEKSLLGR